MKSERLHAALVGALLTDPTSGVNAILKPLGASEAWRRIRDGHGSIPSVLTAKARRLQPDAVQRAADACGAQLILPGDDDWPPQLQALDTHEPWALWVRGNRWNDVVHRRGVGIVGARACTEYGRRTASTFAAEIAEHGNPVVSGGAFGVDIAAHLGALAADGTTICVLASGVDVPYPREHAHLFDRIAQSGAIVSEALPGAGVTKPAFLVRNRLIAALSHGTVVVEARLRSGSISTYAHARALRRILMAVPGPVDAPESAGCNALLKEDAQLVTSGRDVLSLVEPLGTVEPDTTQAPTNEWDDLSAAERMVHEALPARRAISTEALIDETGLFGNPANIIASLSTLTARGLVTELPDGTWRRARALRGALA